MQLPLVVGTDILRSYKRLSYTAWHAIAEFVDNSTQSYFNNKEKLDAASLKERSNTVTLTGAEEDKDSNHKPLRVDIFYSASGGVFRVKDNAMGMSLPDLEAALHLAQPPKNTSGRSKYGLGLKTASCWLGNRWTICTKKLGETQEFTVTFDVNDVASSTALGVTVPYEVKNDVPVDDHYTVVEIRQLNQTFKGRRLGKIPQFLSSMYRQDFRDSTLALFWQGEELSWGEFDGQFLRNSEGTPYKKDFSFSFQDELENKLKTVRGWVGILGDGSRNNAGFSILHANRVVKGWPDSWRPTSIFGPNQGSNDLVNQRLTGEVHLDDFDVSHTKDDILWLSDQEDKVEDGLLEICADYRRIALEYRKGVIDQRGPSPADTAIAIKELQSELSSLEMFDAVHTNPLLPKSLVEAAVSSVVEKFTTARYQERFVAAINGLAVRGYVEAGMSVNDPYVTIEPAKDYVIVIINSAHPHWDQLRGADGVLNYLKECTYDGIAEWQAMNKLSRTDPNTIKLLKDKLLRLSFEIERHAIPIIEDEELGKSSSTLKLFTE